MTFARFLESFADGLVAVIAILAFVSLVGGGLVVWGVVGLARGKPSGRVGAALSAIAAALLAYALFAGTADHYLLPSERVHHVVYPSIVGILLAALGIAHLRAALRRKENAFLDGGNDVS